MESGVATATSPPAAAGTDTPGDDSSLHPALRLRWLALFFVLMFAAMVGWVVATPIWGSADEYQHAYRAYAAARGALYVKPEAALLGTGGYVDVPLGWKKSQYSIACYAGHALGNPACLPPLTNDATPVRLPSTAARYNPVYYVLVGLPSLTFSPSRALYGMRLASGALSAFFLAWALSAAMTVRRPRLAASAVLLAITPMVVFLGAAVNPNGLEISAGLACWVCLALALRLDRGRSRSVLLRRAAISACAMVVTRGLSPFWLLVIAVVLVVFLGLRQRAKLLAPDLLKWSAVVAAAVIGALLWTVLAKALDIGHLGPPTHYTLAHRLDLAWGGFDRQRFLVYGYVGNFGWLDTPLPHSILLPYLAVVTVFVASALILGRWRERAGIALLAVAVFAAPIVLDALSWNKVGAGVWQPRYTLPIEVGLVVLAGLALSARLRSSRLSAWFVPVVLVVCIAATNIAAFVKCLSRYVVGPMHPITLSGGRWQPPLGAWTNTIVESGAWVLLGVAVVLVPTRLNRTVAATSFSDEHPTAADHEVDQRDDHP